MSIYQGTIQIAGGIDKFQTNAGWSLFDCKWSDHLINDMSWLRADTFSWQDGTTYSVAYNHLVTDISGITAETETIGSYTVTFCRATDGHKICLADQETTVNNIYTESGIAWYYILDTDNTQFKLPRTKWGFEGLRDNVGDCIIESLPNITGTARTDATTGLTWGGNTGVFTKDGVGSTAFLSSSTSTQSTYQGLSFDASRSSSTYQNNAPVQERATQMYLYFYVGEHSQTAIEQTAGITSEQLNNKADLTLSNITNANFLAKFQGCGQIYLKTSYVSGTSGYNIWSNGYCEQWGTYQQAGATTYSITFLKTFNIPPHLSCSPHMNTSSTLQYRTMGYSVTTTGFTAYTGTATDYISWKASGYLASGQY